MKKILRILSDYWLLFLILGLISYNALLMRMLPWSSQNLSCELSSSGIKTYNVPHIIDLKINGYGFGKFTNDQYFGNNSFSINTNGSQYSSILVKLFGSSSYDFEIGVKNSKWGETHLFDISKKAIKSPKTGELFNTLMLFDFEADKENDPVAFWVCVYNN
jgi:hypothetical protein